MGKTAALRFRLLGFPVRVTPFFWLMTVLLGWPGSDSFDRDFFIQLGTWIAVVKVSILWHELGHALAMRRYGHEPSITLHWMGGLTHWGPLTSRPGAMERVWVSLAGPFAGFLLGLPFLVLTLSVDIGNPIVERVFLLMTLVNLGYGALNLVPMLPWDGGLAIHGLLDRITHGKGRLPTAIITIIVSILAGAAAYVTFDSPIWPLILCWFSLSAGIRELRAHRAIKNLPAADWLARTRKLMQMPVPVLLHATLGDRPIERLTELADRLQEDGLPRAESPSERAELAEMLAWTRLMAGQVPEARWAVDCMGEGYAPSMELGVLLSLREGDLDAAEAELATGEVGLDDRGLIRAFLLAAQGRSEDVWDAVGHDRDLGALLDVLLFTRGYYDAAAALGEDLFEHFENPTDAYNAACSHDRAERPEQGLRWLERAVDAGFDDVAQLEADDDLRRVRALPEARALIARMRESAAPSAS